MQDARVAGPDRSIWARLSISLTLALTVHASVALALASWRSGAVQAAAASSTEAVWLELGTLSAGGADIGAAAAVAASPAPSRVARRAQRPAVAAQPASAYESKSSDSETPAGPADGARALTGTGASGESGEPGSDVGASGNGATAGAAGSASGARLLGAGDPCAGYFPADSTASRGEVHLSVDVDAQGSVVGSEVLEVRPAGAGFSQAAQSCAARLRFAAARTSSGAPLRSRAILVLRFDRAMPPRGIASERR
jgi:hypothetical protein